MKRLKLKKSSRCAWPDCAKRALKWANGSFDSYCRDHKRQTSREYMQRRRAETPGYGQGRG